MSSMPPDTATLQPQMSDLRSWEPEDDEEPGSAPAFGRGSIEKSNSLGSVHSARDRGELFKDSLLKKPQT